MSDPEEQTLEVRFHQSIAEIDAREWNRLTGTSDPFTRYEFLHALEQHQCVGESFGWLPYHITIRDTTNKLVGFSPLYIKTNSYGEFVFDWSWASAYEQAGIPYYPKLVCSVPYNPVTGARLFAENDLVKKLLIQQTVDVAKKLQMSGAHWLFTDEADTDVFKRDQFMLRLGCQYHWKNYDFSDFDEFLQMFVSRKRKKVNRERRMVQEQNIKIEIIHGNEASEELIELAHSFYTSTFDRKSGIPTLSAGFFKQICASMGSQVVFIFAVLEKSYIACAICMRSEDALFGRFWGSRQEFHSLHFETCFYQGIEYCINNKLKRFEPGAQGEHKITRGFLPTKTWSAHWIANERFRTVLNSFCQREQEAMQLQCIELGSLSPFRSEP